MVMQEKQQWNKFKFYIPNISSTTKNILLSAEVLSNQCSNVHTIWQTQFSCESFVLKANIVNVKNSLSTLI
jgi:hypothetical protein